MLVSSVDDEGRFDHLKWPGTTFLAEQGLEDAGYPLPDMVINGEASGLENICGSFKGRLILEFEIVGETAHAATPYGVNAIDKAVKFIDALKGVELKEGPRQGKESLNVVAVKGVAKRFGDIPDICKVGLEIRVVAPYSTERMRGEIDRTIEELQKSDPNFKIGNVTVFSDRQPFEIKEDEVLVTAIKGRCESRGHRRRVWPDRRLRRTTGVPRARHSRRHLRARPYLSSPQGKRVPDDRRAGESDEDLCYCCVECV